MVKQVNQEISDGLEHKGIKEYIDRAALRARSLKSENNVNNGNDSSSSNRRKNDTLDSDISRKGIYYDHPSLFVKTQRTDRYGLDEDDIRFRVDSGNSGYTQRVVNCFQIIVSLTSDTTNLDLV